MATLTPTEIGSGHEGNIRDQITAYGQRLKNGEMGALPADCVPVDLIVDNGALGASATLDAGILSGDFAKVDGARTMGNEFVAAAAAATARGTNISARCARWSRTASNGR